MSSVFNSTEKFRCVLARLPIVKEAVSRIPRDTAGVRPCILCYVAAVMVKDSVLLSSNPKKITLINLSLCPSGSHHDTLVTVTFIVDLGLGRDDAGLAKRQLLFAGLPLKDYHGPAAACNRMSEDHPGGMLMSPEVRRNAHLRIAQDECSCLLLCAQGHEAEVGMRGGVTVRVPGAPCRRGAASARSPGLRRMYRSRAVRRPRHPRHRAGRGRIWGAGEG